MTHRSAVKSAHRVFEILELFAEDRTPRRPVEVARQMHYPVSSTAALLRTMTACGYLAFEPRSRTYFPSVRLFQLTQRLHGMLRPVLAARADSRAPLKTSGFQS